MKAHDLYKSWQESIRYCREIVKNNDGPELAVIVSGTEADAAYWREDVERFCPDIFRANGDTTIISIPEYVKKGNFLGTLNAYSRVKDINPIDYSQLCLMSMVFGKGKRLSPFTQALGERKPAFTTPMWGDRSGAYLPIADVSNLYTNALFKHLKDGGFQGFLVKWGDEAIIPEFKWSSRDYSGYDAIRVVMRSPLTEILAREKDWVVIDPKTMTMKYEVSRQGISSMQKRINEVVDSGCELTLNLGFTGLSYDFLEIATQVFNDDMSDNRKWADWDPYIWIGLLCESEEQWHAEIRHEQKIGKNGLSELLARYPDLFSKIMQIRSQLRQMKGRDINIGVVDYGEVLWVDCGLHERIRESFNELIKDTPDGKALRDLFGLPHTRDHRGNIILRSKIPARAAISNSIIVDTIVQDDQSVVNGGCIIGSRIKKILMPFGGTALFCASDLLQFDGINCIAFRSVGRELYLPEGGRATTIFFEEKIEHLISNEQILDYEGTSYNEAILGNSISFDEAGKIASAIGGEEIHRRWYYLWNSWLSL